VQDIAAERGHFRNQDYWSVRKDGQTKIVLELRAVFVLASGAANINQHSDVF
jgi:hypothetical protein